jgi:hypothetical protein
LLERAMTQQRLSACAHDRILKVARTGADIEEQANIEPKHIAEAIQYPSLGRTLVGVAPRQLASSTQTSHPRPAKQPASFASQRRTLSSSESLYAADFSFAITSSSVRNVLNPVLRARCVGHMMGGLGFLLPYRGSRGAHQEFSVAIGDGRVRRWRNHKAVPMCRQAGSY